MVSNVGFNLHCFSSNSRLPHQCKKRTTQWRCLVCSMLWDTWCTVYCIYHHVLALAIYLHSPSKKYFNVLLVKGKYFQQDDIARISSIHWFTNSGSAYGWLSSIGQPDCLTAGNFMAQSSFKDALKLTIELSFTKSTAAFNSSLSKVRCLYGAAFYFEMIWEDNFDEYVHQFCKPLRLSSAKIRRNSLTEIVTNDMLIS